MNFELKIMNWLSIDIEEYLINNRDIKKLSGEKNWCECYASKFEDVDQVYVFKFLYKERYYSIEYYFRMFEDEYNKWYQKKELRYGLNVCFYKNDDFINSINLSLRDMSPKYCFNELERIFKCV
jgi:hypothetical protein